jgi:hypothetical protein
MYRSDNITENSYYRFLGCWWTGSARLNMPLAGALVSATARHVAEPIGVRVNLHLNYAL